MLTFKEYLTEVFDNPYTLDRERDFEEILSKSNKTLKQVLAYTTKDQPGLIIYRFWWNGAYEYHFTDVTLGGKQGLRTHDQNPSVGVYNRIIATISDMIVSQLKAKTHAIRLVGVDDTMTNLYLKVVKYLSKKLDIKLIIQEIPKAKTSDGKIKRVIMIKRDNNTFSLPESISEALLRRLGMVVLVSLIPSFAYGECASYDRSTFVTESLVTKVEVLSEEIVKLDSDFGKCIVTGRYVVGQEEIDITSSFPYDLRRDSEQKACEQAMGRGKAEAVRRVSPGKLTNTQILVCGDSPKNAPGIYRQVDDSTSKNLPWKRF